MRVFKKGNATQSRPTYEPDRVDKDAVYNQNVSVKGTCGFVGSGPLPRNAMPNTRLQYVRPDGRPDDHSYWRELNRSRRGGR